MNILIWMHYNLTLVIQTKTIWFHYNSSSPIHHITKCSNTNTTWFKFMKLLSEAKIMQLWLLLLNQTHQPRTHIKTPISIWGKKITFSIYRKTSYDFYLTLRRKFWRTITTIMVALLSTSFTKSLFFLLLLHWFLFSSFKALTTSFGTIIFWRENINSLESTWSNKWFQLTYFAFTYTTIQLLQFFNNILNSFPN